MLVGRDRARLEGAVAATGAARAVVAATPAEIGRAVQAGRPAVVVNTIGPFARTAPPLAKACLPHSS